MSRRKRTVADLLKRHRKAERKRAKKFTRAYKAALVEGTILRQAEPADVFFPWMGAKR